MRRCTWPLTASALLWGCGVALAEPRGAGEKPAAAAGEVMDVVFLGDTGPVLLRLHVRIDGQPYQAVYRAAWEDYLQALFRQLDRDGDGFLNEAEAQGLPPPPQQSPGDGAGRPTNLAFNFRVVDGDGNGKIDLPELVAYYRDYGGSGLLVGGPSPPRVLRPNGNDALQGLVSPTAVPVSPAVSEALFNRLDTDKDGKLSREELAAAEAVLLPLDADGDELLTPAELLPGRFASAPLPAANAAPAASAFVFLGQGVDGPTLARRLLERYGRRRAVPGKRLSRDDLGLDADTFIRLDANHDGYLDAGELEKFAVRAPDLDFLVRLGKTQPGEPPLEVLATAGRLASAVRPSGDGTLLLSCGTTRIELRANAGRPVQVSRLRERHLAEFRAADAGRKGYLTLKDAEVAGFFPGQFRLLDRNGEGRLTEKELLTYLDEVQERQARAVTSIVSVQISAEGHGLFELLDRNRDGKLGRRELRGASRLLAQLGREKEGLSRGDVPRSYQLAVGLCQASFNRAGGHGTFSPRGMPLLTLDWSRPDLIWFDKMDRNRDGDVSLREFLGSREDFRRIDTDGDGLISLDEALQAAKLFGKPGRAP